MRRVRLASLGAAALLLGSGVACTQQKARTKASSTPSSVPFAVDFDRTEFDDDSATIDNEWFPLKPGTQLTWEGQAFDGEDVIKRRVVMTVTDLTKEIAGVQTLVGWERDYNDGVLAESELIFLAQDTQGNVRHFGQYVEIYDEEGKFDGGSAWLVGYLEGAKSGILMQASPQAGTPTYSEGFAPPPFFWDDVARVYKTGQKTCVKTGCYSDVLIIEESEPSKPDAFQLKYYARGVGNVRVGWRGEEEEEKETLELVKVIQLSPAELEQARIEAMNHEARAALYGRTPPAERRPQATASSSP